MTSAKLIGFTQPVGIELPELETAQDLIAYCARVSNPSNQMNKETQAKSLSDIW